MAIIRIDIETLRATETGSALGQIWIDFENLSLPCPRWDDFIVFVLDWWRRGIENILTQSDEPAIFAFMEDMHEITITPVGGGLQYVSLFHDEENASGIEDGTGLRDFLQSYCDVVRAVLNRIENEGGWQNTYDGSLSQIEDLRAALPRFESLLGRFETVEHSLTLPIAPQ